LADVQLEHGHIRIANSIFDAILRQHLTSREWAVLMAVLRLTWGWGVKDARIGSAQIGDMTGIDQRHVRRALNALRDRRMLMRQRDGKQFARWQIRKDFEQWVSPGGGQKSPGQKSPHTRAKTARKPGPIRPPSRTREQKEEKNPTNVGGKKGDLIPIRETIKEVLS
jgi:phage replication O-like protein O